LCLFLGMMIWFRFPNVVASNVNEHPSLATLNPLQLNQGTIVKHTAVLAE
jgi:hypothetical protein